MASVEVIASAPGMTQFMFEVQNTEASLFLVDLYAEYLEFSLSYSATVRGGIIFTVPDSAISTEFLTRIAEYTLRFGSAG